MLIYENCGRESAVAGVLGSLELVNKALRAEEMPQVHVWGGGGWGG